MTTSLRTWNAFVERRGGPVTPAEKAYFRTAMRNKFHSSVLRKFAESHLSRKEIADYLGINKSQVTRWLSHPNNMTTNSMADLLLAMSAWADLNVEDLAEVQADKYQHPMAAAHTPTNLLLGESGNDTVAATSGTTTVRFNVRGGDLLSDQAVALGS